MEQNFWDLDQARLDFLWVVHESGEVWQPDISSVWDTHYFERSGREGPPWPIDTDVDIVAGFVDLNGDLLLMRITRTIFRPF